MKNSKTATPRLLGLTHQKLSLKPNENEIPCPCCDGVGLIIGNTVKRDKKGREWIVPVVLREYPYCKGDQWIHPETLAVIMRNENDGF